MPFLEALACGLDVIATAGGPTDELVPDALVRRVPSRRVDLPRELARALGISAGGWWLEPDRDALRDRVEHGPRPRAGGPLPSTLDAHLAPFAWSARAERLLELVRDGG